MNGSDGALVCGFGDLGAGLGGVAWSFAGGGGLLLSDGDVSEVEVELRQADGAQEIEMRRDGVTVTATLTPRRDPVSLQSPEGDDPTGGPLEATACEATVASSGGTQTLQCAGQVCRWSGDPLAAAGTFRHLAIEGPGDSLLVIVAQGPPGAEGHDEEDVGAWLLEETGAVTFGESLVSTQYDGSARPTRIGVELWPQGEEQTARAAATRGSGSRLGGAETDGLRAALLRCHTEGAEGLGSYLVWRG